jgi:hypothetical protein
MLDDPATSIITSVFVCDLDNAKRAVKEKNYGQVVVLGNRLLSDLVITWDTLSEPLRASVAVTGIVTRIVGINLNALSSPEKQFPSVKLRNSATVLFSNLKDKFSRSPGSLEPLMAAFVEYCKVWSVEMNTFENTSYGKSEAYENSLLKWIRDSLNASTDLSFLKYSYPFHGITNEISRALFEREGNRPLHDLYLLMSALQWQHETSSKIELYIRHYDKSKDSTVDDLPYISKTKEYCERTILVVNALTEDSAKAEASFGTLLCEIVRDWRKSLNSYYQFNTGVQIIKSGKDEFEDKGDREYGPK